MHYGVYQSTIKRWMREAGEAELIERRRGYLRNLYASRGLPNTGGRKPGVRFGGMPEMPARHPALAWMPIRRVRRAFTGRLSSDVDPFDEDICGVE